MDVYVQTIPPTHVPHPIPILKIAEKIAIATEDADCGTHKINSDWNVTLYAITAIPHTAQSMITLYFEIVAG